MCITMYNDGFRLSSNVKHITLFTCQITMQKCMMIKIYKMLLATMMWFRKMYHEPKKPNRNVPIIRLEFALMVMKRNVFT